jgi:Putative auto-transporter adhesin, head GIN domain
MIKLILAIVLTIASTFANAQLKGSGKTVTKNYNFKNFDKIYFDDLDGKIELEIGTTWTISVTIDDNLEKLLSFDQDKSDAALTLFFKGNYNNKMYVEDTNIKIKITMPSIKGLRHNGNSSLIVTNCNTNNLKIDNLDNAFTKISGTVNYLIIRNSGNGNLYADKLFAKTAVIKCSGNGNATVNVSDKIIGKTSGNGNIINKGAAKFDSESSISGNGSLINQ